MGRALTSIESRWNAASFFVKQARYQQIAAAHAAGNIALADELATVQWCRRVHEKFQTTVSGPVYIPEDHRRPQQAIFLLWVLGVEESAIGAAQRDQLYSADRRDAGRRFLATVAGNPNPRPVHHLRSADECEATRRGQDTTSVTPFRAMSFRRPESRTRFTISIEADAAA